MDTHQGELTVERGNNRELIVRHTSIDKIDSVLVWLHGLGDSAEGFLPVFYCEDSPVPAETKVRLLTAPLAPVTLNNRMIMNSWYDIKLLDSNDSKRSYSHDDVDINSKAIQQIIDEEAKRFGGDYKKVFIGGFSQGCAMALHNGCHYGDRLGGIIGLSGYLLGHTKIPENMPPTLLTHGADDDVVPIDLALKSYENIRKSPSVKFNQISYLGHGLNDEVFKLVKQFKAKCLKK